MVGVWVELGEGENGKWNMGLLFVCVCVCCHS